jgi:hypothetical protein
MNAMTEYTACPLSQFGSQSLNFPIISLEYPMVLLHVARIQQLDRLPSLAFHENEA